MTYSIRRYKSFMGMDTKGFNCELCRDGKPVATVVNDGSGRSLMFRWLDSVEEKMLDDHCATLPAMVYDGVTLKMEAELFVGCLVDQLEMDRCFKRQQKKSTLFRLPSDAEGQYHRLNSTTPYGESDIAWLDKKYGKGGYTLIPLVS